MKQKFIRHTALVIIIFVTFAAIIISAENKLSDKAKGLYKRGLSAARQSEWQLAIKYFKACQKLANQDPHVLLSLGLAYDKVGGRELLAIAWYRAYLAVLPQATNAKQIRERIFDLQIKAEASAAKLIRMGKQAALQLPDKNDRRYPLSSIAALLAQIGQVEEAYLLINNLLVEKSSQEYAYLDVAKAQAKAGDFSGARDTVRKKMKSNSDSASSAYLDIARIQAKKGDPQGALETTNSITKPNNRANALLAIAKAYTKKKKYSTARNLIEEAERISNSLKKIAKKYLRYDIGNAFAANGDFAAAQTIANEITNTNYRSNAFYHIIKSKIKRGELVSALLMASAVSKQDSYYSNIGYALKRALNKYVTAGKLQECLNIINRLPESLREQKWLSEVSLNVVSAYLKKKDYQKARSLAKKIENREMRSKACRILATKIISTDYAGASSLAVSITTPKDISKYNADKATYLLKEKQYQKATQAIQKINLPEEIDNNTYVKLINLQLDAERKKDAKTTLAKTMQGLNVKFTNYDIDDLVKVILKLGDLTQAREIVAKIPNDSYMKPYASKELIRYLVKVGKIAEAFQEADKSPLKKRQNIYTELINSLIKNNQLMQAKKAIQRIIKKDNLLKKLANKYLKINNLEAAKNITKQISAQTLKDTAWQNIAKWHLDNNDINSALLVEKSINASLIKDKLFFKIMQYYALNKDFVHTEEFIGKITSPTVKSEACRSLVSSLLSYGADSQARKKANEAIRSAARVKKADERFTELLQAVAIITACEPENTRIPAAGFTALACIPQIEEDYSKNNAYTDYYLRHPGLIRIALALGENALAKTTSVIDGYARLAAKYITIGDIYSAQNIEAELKNNKKNQATGKLILENLLKLGSLPAAKNYATAEVKIKGKYPANIFAAQGDYQNALTAARKIADARTKCSVLGEIAQQFNYAGKQKIALFILKEALLEVEQINDYDGKPSYNSRASAYLEIAKIQNLANALPQVKKSLKHSIKAIDIYLSKTDTPYYSTVLYYYNGIAEMMVKIGRKKEAEKILQKMEKIVKKEAVTGNVSNQGFTYYYLVNICALIDKDKRGEKWLKKIKQSSYRSASYFCLVRTLVLQGNLDKALQILKTNIIVTGLPEFDSEEWFKVQLVNILAYMRKFQKAKELLKTINNSRYKKQALRNIILARCYLKMECASLGQEYKNNLAKPFLSLTNNENYLTSYLRQGDLASAKVVAEIATNIINRSYLYSLIHKHYLLNSQFDEANKLIPLLTEPSTLVWALRDTALAYYQSGNKKHPRQILERAEKAVVALAPAFLQGIAYIDLSQAAKSCEENELAQIFQTKALQLKLTETERTCLKCRIAGLSFLLKKVVKNKKNKKIYSQKKEVAKWLSHIRYPLNEPLYSDPQSYIQSLGNKGAKKMVDGLISGAKDILQEISKIKEMELSWQKKRKALPQ